ncbi:YvcK family protein [Persephonella atlantica]|uniref:Putative gluconeogenesis factor n=1 Tax=Persephonella atlantica TaxID=2699429 RepID=A0ABS1GJA6_9AQUI|nr:YvcK family protein [Persephonella atlantica]MBK3332975.1 YvcK family protein [Persephonella atlantica]
MKVVAIGGGTGLSSLLRGIKHLVPHTITDLSAIVTVADNGGSSGRLREEMQIPAPGDIRNCIVALAEDEDILAKVFQYRFTEGNGLKGHSFGNLFLSVLTKITGDFLDAVEITSDILKIKGKIIPSTDEMVDIVAEFTDGAVIKGETQITEYGKQLKGKIKNIWMEPSNVKAPEEAVQKIMEADVIILGPGSLFTSIIPNLLVSDIKDAVLKSKAYKIYICNVMTQYGETDQFTASDHIKAIHSAVGKPFIDAAVVNTTVPPDELLRKYMKENAEPVTVDAGNISRMGITVFAEDLLETGDYVRHNPYKLTALIDKILKRIKKRNAA